MSNKRQSIKRENMKKTGIILGIALIALTGCTGENREKSQAQQSTPEETTAQANPANDPVPVPTNQPSVEKEPDPVKDSGSGEKTVKKPIKLTRDDFLNKVMNYEKNTEKWVYEGEKPCLIDFYADWCAPCRITSPILEELAVEYAGKIHIYKVDTQKEKELAAVFGIRSIPSFLFCPMEGKPVMTAGIAQTPEATRQMFRERIDNLLLKQ